MDTPDRNRISIPLSKFEDSPVFNYINSLSPIKPVKSLHVAQTFHSLSFASIPSVFTSPHVSSHKESRFFSRNQTSDLLTLELPVDDGDEDKASAAVDASGSATAGDLSDCCLEPEKCDIAVSIEEFNLGPSNERSNLSVRLPQALHYVDALDCDNPRDAMPCYATKMDMVEPPASLVKFSQENLARICFEENEVEIQEQCQLEQTKEKAVDCDWENLISDGAVDVLIYNSATESDTCQGEDLDLGGPTAPSLVSNLAQKHVDDSQMKEAVGSFSQRHPGEVVDGEQKETDHTPQLPPSVYEYKQEKESQSEKMDEKADGRISHGSKADAQLQRGMRRRCLVFEAAGHKKNVKNDPERESSNSMQSESKCPDDKRQVSLMPKIASSPCPLPGIGLHLNSLASTSKDFKLVKHETLTSGNRLISMPTSVGSFYSLTAGKKSLELVPYNAQGDFDSSGNEGQLIQDDSQATTHETGEEFNQNSPRKKRRRSDNAGESEACKRCNCKKSKCLKLYCECFAAGVYCVEPCSCHDCFNKPIHEDTVLTTRKQIESRNPLAFAPKVIRNTGTVSETGEDGNSTPASARHKRGCNCKKSNCLKKYCECYQGGVGCSTNCRCEGCKNAFGRKDGSCSPAETETEQEEEVSDVGEKDGLDKSQQIIDVNEDEQLLDAVLPMTPFQICRSSLHVSFLFSGRPPRPSLVAGGSSSCQTTCQKLRKPDFVRSQLTIEKHFQINPEDETPEILKGNCSSNNGVKTTSPNRKRVSPPNGEFGLSPGQKSSRKLILQSIPSFPSLTPLRDK